MQLRGSLSYLGINDTWACKTPRTVENYFIKLLNTCRKGKDNQKVKKKSL